MAQQQIVNGVGQARVRINGTEPVNLSKVSVSVEVPVSKQKSALAISIAKGIPDPSLEFSFLTPADRKLYGGLNLALRTDLLSVVLEIGVEKYLITGVYAKRGAIDNTPATAETNNSASLEGALIKQIA